MRTLAVVAVLSILPPAVARLAAAQTSGPGPTVSLADSTSVPMEVPDGRAIVSVTLNGRGPYRLAVETGSPDVLISSQVVTDLSLRATGMGEDDSVFVLDSLRIGAALIRSLPVGRNSAFERLGVDGVLGLVAYRDVLLTVDYPHQRLELAQARLPEPDGLDVMRAVRVGPFVGIPVVLGGVKETGVIDTQGGIGFSAIDQVASRLSFQSPPKVVGRAVVGGGAPVPVRRGVLAGDALLGRHRIRQPPIAIHPLPPDIPSHVTIGLGVLRHFTIAIDQRSMAVRLTRSDTTEVRLE
ncbi:MAG TPA: hypothetical protein VIG08_17645 [Gemmatimonadales bacterium]|jgi:hypothetical protein